MTFTINFQPMTKAFNTPQKPSMVRNASTGIALALAPLVVFMGIAAVLAPPAEARVVCYRIGTGIVCY